MSTPSPRTSGPRTPGQRHGRPALDASMTLLTEVMQRPLDPGYAEAAARRAAGDEPPRLPVTWVWVALLAVFLGFMTVTAAKILRAPEPSVIAARTVLENEIVARQAEVDDLTGRLTDLSTDIEQLQNDALATRSPELLALLQLDGVATGSSPVTGPGLVVTMRDAGGGLTDPEDIDPDDRVQDVDLQMVVNALWASGAEAIAINDERLTPLSAIRSAGGAVLVDLQPLTGPYQIQAIGDSEKMQTGFARSSASEKLSMLSSGFGIQHSIIAQSELELPGSGAQRLLYAEPVQSSATEPDPASTPRNLTDGMATDEGSTPESPPAGQENAE